jgi:hypothetical protein
MKQDEIQKNTFQFYSSNMYFLSSSIFFSFFILFMIVEGVSHMGLMGSKSPTTPFLNLLSPVYMYEKLRIHKNM